MKNFVPVDLGNPNLSEQIAESLLKHPQWSNHIGSSTAILIEPNDSYKICKPLVDAVNRICSWSDIFYIMFFSVNPGVEMIHQDIDHGHNWALNIPILNCKETYTAFYEPLLGEAWTPPTAEQRVESGVDDYMTWRKDQIEEVERMYFTQPVLFNISTIHCIHNLTNQPRISLSIRMRCDLIEKYNLMQK